MSYLKCPKCGSYLRKSPADRNGYYCVMSLSAEPKCRTGMITIEPL